MGCGGCKAEVDALQKRVDDLVAVLDELRAEYLALAADFDELVAATGVGNDEENEDV